MSSAWPPDLALAGLERKTQGLHLRAAEVLEHRRNGLPGTDDRAVVRSFWVLK